VLVGRPDAGHEYRARPDGQRQRADADQTAVTFQGADGAFGDVSEVGEVGLRQTQLTAAQPQLLT